MFEVFFHLKENPFSLAPSPRFLFRSREHDEALAHLRYWIENNEGFVLVTGEVGTGKTTALYDLMAQLPTEWSVAMLNHSTLSELELLEEICRRFHIEVTEDANKPKLLGRIESYLLECRSRGIGALLIIDEAQNLEKRMLEEVRLLSNMERLDGKLLQIALVGQPELEAKLRSPELRQLRQRIGIKYRLGPLTQDETTAYIQHRITVAGGDAQHIFPASSCHEVHQLTHGIPREINIVCSQAFINAFVEEAPQVMAEHVRSVVTDFAFKSIAPPVDPQRARELLSGRHGNQARDAGGHPAAPAGSPRPPAKPMLGVVGGRSGAAEMAVDLERTAAEPSATPTPAEQPAARVERATQPEPAMAVEPAPVQESIVEPAADTVEAPAAGTTAAEAAAQDGNEPQSANAGIGPDDRRGWPQPLTGMAPRRHPRSWPWLVAALIVLAVLVWLLTGDALTERLAAGDQDAGDASGETRSAAMGMAAHDGAEAEGPESTGLQVSTGAPASSSTLPGGARQAELPANLTIQPGASSPEQTTDDGGTAPLTMQIKPGESYFTIHIASFRDPDRADQLRRDLAKTFGHQVEIVPTHVLGELWYRIYLGRFQTRTQAMAVADSVKGSRLVPSTVIILRSS